ncbi:hypothetical protein [Rhizobium setariae]|nr:hypothetical protein [Rhizobium setariae]
MRFSTYLISFVLVAGPALAGQVDRALTSATIDKSAEMPLGPLAPDDARLGRLYTQLKKERNPEAASIIAEEIRQALTRSGSPTVDLLMSNATKSIDAKRYGAALDFLDLVTLIDPEYAEGWNRRATVHYLMGNIPKAMADTAHVLALEPRHIGALAGLAGMLNDGGRDAQSLLAWQQYLEYYPADRDAQKEALDLINKLAGQKT